MDKYAVVRSDIPNSPLNGLLGGADGTEVDDPLDVPSAPPGLDDCAQARRSLRGQLNLDRNRSFACGHDQVGTVKHRPAARELTDDTAGDRPTLELLGETKLAL